MRKPFVWMTGVVLVCVLWSPAEARQRPKKPVEYYTYSKEFLADRIAAFSAYDRVILSNELVTRVTQGEFLCKLEWARRRVDYFAAAGLDSARFALAMPRGAKPSEVDLYVISRDGRSADRVKAPSMRVDGDTLRVSVAVETPRVVDLQVKMEGEGITVDESFPFTLVEPVVSCEYRFAVSRKLLQKAADEGVSWEFAATTEPRTWPPTHADDPDFFCWYWRTGSVDPSARTAAGQERSVSVNGFLPNAALAGIDPSQLPKLESLADVSLFEQRLIEQMKERTRDSGGLPGGLTTPTDTRSTLPGVPTKR